MLVPVPVYEFEMEAVPEEIDWGTGLVDAGLSSTESRKVESVGSSVHSGREE